MVALGHLGCLVVLATIASGTGSDSGGVTLSVWNNSAWAGEPQSSEVVPGLSLSRELPTGSTLEMVGTLELPAGSQEYNFSCSFGNTTMGFLWIDDHLVCQDGNIYKPPVSRTDLPLRRLSKASLPVVLRAYTAPARLPRGKVHFIGNYFDGNHGLAGPRVLRFGPQSYGFTPQSCADACTKYEYAALQDIGGRFARKACPGAVPGTCTNLTGFCSCDNGLAHVESQGVPTEPGCLKPVQSCSYVNSVYSSAPAPPPPPAGSVSHTISIDISWQPLTSPAAYGQVGTPLAPLLSLGRDSMPRVAAAAAAAVGGSGAQPSLTPQLTPVEQQRRAMQQGLASGWATWVFDDLIALASLPSAATVRPVICL